MLAPRRPLVPPVLDQGAGRRIAGVLIRLAIGDSATVSIAQSTAIPARVAAIAYRALTLEMGEFMHPGINVEVRFDRGPVVLGIVRQCGPRSGSFEVHLNLFDAQVEYEPGFVRAEERYPVQITGTLRAPSIHGAVYTVTIVDVSKSGLRLRCPKALPPGTRVEVHCREADISGEVRYSREIAPDEFHVGVQADANSKVFAKPGDPDLSALRHG